MINRLAFVAVLLALMLQAEGCGEKAKNEEPVNVPVGVNIIENPSFENWKGAVPEGWQLQYLDGYGERMNLYGKSLKEKKSGEASFYLRGAFNSDRWMILVQRHRVAPRYRLSFSAEIKTRDLQKSRGQMERSNIFVRFFDKDGKRLQDRQYADVYTPYQIGTNEWRRFEKRVEIPKNAQYADFGLVCEMSGSIFFDDFEATLEKPIPWKEIRTKYVDYYYLDSCPFPQGAIDKENAFVKDCVKKLRLKTEGKVGYYYYTSVEKLQELESVKNKHELRSYGKREFHTTESFKDHEMVHMLLAPLGYPPLGLAEGAVYYVLGSLQGRDIHLIAKELIAQQQLPPLYNVFRIKEMNDLGMEIAIPGWGSFGIWLIDREGIDKFMKLYKDSNGVETPSSFDAVFKNVYKKDFDSMDREWRQWVMSYQARR
ncbi:MAG: hypothetical protein PHD74_04025 [Candidatus Krumholzibacteria bacterium]|nr:hypothetical protein [Candidatus Krumholzibacteria bacterium]